MSATIVRPAVDADAASIAAIGRIAFPPTYAGFLDARVIDVVVEQLYTDSAVQQSLARSRTDPAARFLVAESDGEMVGFLDYDERGAEPELHRIYLQPGAVGGGVGSALMNALHESLPAGAGYVLLVAAENRKAIGFYRRHGLQVRQTIDAIPYYREVMDVEIPADAVPVPAHIMERAR